jgi:hypothetical protein
MANHTPNPDSNYDPAGSTQMFRAFVDERPATAEVQRAETRGRAGLVIGVIVALVVIVGVVVLALK